MRKDGRRKLLLASGALLAAPLTSFAQSEQKVRRIGFLSEDTADADWAQSRQRLILESLGRAGYRAGRDIVMEWRFAGEKPVRLRELADDLVRLEVDVLVAWGNQSTHAAAQATRTIPIVMYAYNGNPVHRRLVASLARPGGNVTGTMAFVDIVDMVVKQYELLKQALPSAVRVASLWSSWAPNAEQLVAEMHDRVYKELGLVVVSFVVHNSDEIPSALDRIAAFKPDAIYTATTADVRTRLAEVATFAIRQKLVLTGSGPQAVAAGGLIYYGPDSTHLLDRTVRFVDRILHGAKPADLPVEQLERYELVFNARTARAIGYTLPRTLQLRVDRVIE